jgi:hypothetical protein
LIGMVEEMECVLMWLELRLNKSKVIKKGRREEVLEVLVREKELVLGILVKLWE